MNILIGYTGFVGSNIYDTFCCDYVFNSKNISESYGLNPDLCIYSGIRAEKFYANNNPEWDLMNINNAITNIKKINPKKLVLISTIDVLDSVDGTNEDYIPVSDNLLPYGKNRLYLENWCSANIKNCYIIRLPGLFGKNIKKNFIYDLINGIPNVLNETLYNELLLKDGALSYFYKKQVNGFYKSTFDEEHTKHELFRLLKEIGFSSVSFTDSRSVFQFYNLKYIGKHIETIVKERIPISHLATEPVSAGEVYFNILRKPFTNEISKKPFSYNFKTKYADIFGGKNGYIFDKSQVISELTLFVKENRNEFSCF